MTIRTPFLRALPLIMLIVDSIPGLRSTSFQSPSSTRAKSLSSLTMRSILLSPSRVRSIRQGRLDRL